METPAPANAKSRSRISGKNWFLRVDGPEEFLRQKCRVISEWIDVEAVLAVYHIGSSKENPHCHCVISAKNVLQKQSWDVRIKQLFDVKGSQYSSKLWDGVRDAGASSYLFHENTEIILVRKGWTDDEILSAKATNALVQKVVAVNKEKASTKLVEKALAHFDGEQNVRKYDILKYMLLECRDGGSYYPGEYKLKQYVEEVELKRTDKVGLDTYADQMFMRLWR